VWTKTSEGKRYRERKMPYLQKEKIMKNDKGQLLYADLILCAVIVGFIGGLIIIAL
jgi:hypothetical protein